MDYSGKPAAFGKNEGLLAMCSKGEKSASWPRSVRTRIRQPSDLWMVILLYKPFILSKTFIMSSGHNLVYSEKLGNLPVQQCSV